MDDIKINVKNVSQYYLSKDNKNVHALDNVNIEVYKGEFLGLIGSSGCGKSTLLNLMANILEPTKGEIKIHGDEKQKIGYISQSDTLLPWRNIIDNVCIGLELEGIKKNERYDRAKSLIDMSGLTGFENKYPFELSGGMRKRAIIIRAFMTNPDIVFMDEPFGPLDVFTKEILMDEILKIWDKQKSTVIYVTHDITEAITLADRIALMSYRPSNIKSIYEVNFSRPRDIQSMRYCSQFVELEKRIREDIKNEILKAKSDEMKVI